MRANPLFYCAGNGEPCQVLHDGIIRLISANPKTNWQATGIGERRSGGITYLLRILKYSIWSKLFGTINMHQGEYGGSPRPCEALSSGQMAARDNFTHLG